MYITGGSAGLGLSLARLITKRGAHVSIVARNEEKLNKALASLEVRPLYLCLKSVELTLLDRNYVLVQTKY